MLVFSCDSCGQRYQVDATLAGKKIKCKKCEKVLTIPAAPATTPGPKAKPRRALQTFGAEPTAASRPPLKKFGSTQPASPSDQEHSSPPPSAKAEPEPVDIEIVDEEESSDPYSLDTAYEPPKAPMSDQEGEPTPPRPGTAKAPKKRRLEYASFWSRLAAILIDGILCVVVAFGVSFAIQFSLSLSGVKFDNPLLFLAIASVVAFLTTTLYFAIMTSSERQATLGKTALGIKVTDLNGQRISLARSLAREFSRIPSALIPFAIGYIMAAFTKRRQAVHDMIAGTLVVKK